MILTDLFCFVIICLILLRIPDKYEMGFSKDLLQSVSGNSQSPKNIRKQFDSFIYSFIILFLCQYVLFNYTYI